jgi:hypothetical protein
MSEFFESSSNSNERLQQTALERFGDIEGSKLRYYQTLSQLLGLGSMPETVEEVAKKMGWINGRNYTAFADEQVERNGDREMARKVINAAVKNPNKKVAILSLGGGTTYPVTGYTPDFNSDWFSRRLQMAGLDNLEVLTTDIIPDTTQSRDMTDFGFFHVPMSGQLFFSAFQTRRSYYSQYISEEQETFSMLLGAPPVSKLTEGSNPVFETVDSEFITGLFELYEAFGKDKGTYGSSMQFNPQPPIQTCIQATGFDPRNEGRSYIRPLVDKDMERIAFGLSAQGSVDALHLEKSFKKSTFDFITMRHNGSYLEEKDLALIEPYLKEGGEMLFSGNAYRGKWVEDDNRPIS